VILAGCQLKISSSDGIGACQDGEWGIMTGGVHVDAVL